MAATPLATIAFQPSRNDGPRRWQFSCLRWCATALVLLLSSSRASPSDGPTPDLPIRDYTSPSGEFSLQIDPGDRYGAGPATYRFRRSGQPDLVVEHPFTLLDAAVADDGVVAGFGYSDGLATPFDAPGEFHVAILHADGSVRMLERTPRTDSAYLHTAPDPKARGVFIDPGMRRAVVRVWHADINTGGEQWWIYPLDQGDRSAQQTLSPPDALARRILAVQPLDDGALTLVHWLYGGGNGGDLFALVDADGGTVWQQMLPNSMSAADDNAVDTMRSDGPDTFSLHDRQEGVEIAYRVTRGDTDWQVVEQTRRPWQRRTAPPPNAHAETVIPIIEAVELGRHRLTPNADASSDPTLGDVRSFAIDADGRFAIVLGATGDGTQRRLRVLDASGALLGETSLAAWFDCHCELSVAPVGNRWLVASENASGAADANVVAVAADGSSAVAIDALRGVSIAALAGLDDGFVALTEQQNEQALVAYASDGSVRWRIDQDYSDDRAIFSPADIAVTSDGDVIVLEQVSDALKVFDGHGHHRRTVDLAKSWHRTPSYPTDVAADPRGGITLHDFQGTPSVVHMRSDDSVAREFTPALADGRQFTMRAIAIDPSGSLWTTDGHALLRLDDDGRVIQAIGSLPDTDVLGEIGDTAIDSNGQTYAVDVRTAAVHVFDETGKPLRICRPLPDDHQDDAEVELAVADDGGMWLERSRVGEDGVSGYVHFAADCERLGSVRLALDTVSQTWLAARGSDRRWVLGYKRLYLLDADGATLAKRERASDGQWLDHLGSAAVAPDGTLAVVSSASGGNNGFVALFDAAGQPLHTVRPPAGFQRWHPVAFDGLRLFFGWSTDAEAAPTAVIVTDLDGQPLYQLVPRTGRTIRELGLVRRDGRDELWLFDGGRTIDRMAVPEP